MTILVNESIAIDAGCLGFLSPLDAQTRVEHVLLSHGHLDHVASLPIFLDNVYQAGATCPTIHAIEPVWNALREHLFNDVIWPDLIRLSKEKTPFLRAETLNVNHPLEINGLSILPIELDHVVPTVGFIIDDGDASVGICWDTQPTTTFWEHVNRQQNLRAIFIEASFPNSMAWLAQEANHLTPATLGAEIGKLSHETELIAIHLKPAFHEKVAAELDELGLAKLQVGEPNRVYEF